MSATPLSDLAPGDFAVLRRLLDEALDLPASERAAWLARLPQEQSALRPQLEGLLAHADDATQAPRTASRLTLPRLAPSDEAEPPLPPDAGPYRAIRLLGEGGMGRVWLAERTDMLHGRPVALKLPHAAWRHPRLAERMAQEREILAVLDHPNIARIYDAGVAADGQPYLALEYIEGECIDEHAKRLGLGVRERVALFLQVTAAVAHAHARLVVHRDLKPGNILVTRDGRARLLDFGIARLLGAADAAELTAPAQRALTPAYAAPEQILGQPIGTAADIYSLGVVLYELLTGELPYRPRRASAAALEDTIVHAEPPRPSQRSADAQARRALQGDLDTVLLKALKKDPAERYPTVQGLADDLANWLADRPVRARPDSAWYHARKFVRRNRLGVSLAAGFVLSLGAALGVALWQAQEARAQAAKANAITGFLVGLFQANDIEQADGRAKREQSVQQLLEHSADALATGLAGQPALRAELQGVVGGLLNNLEITDAAIRVRRARLQSLREHGAAPRDELGALRALGESLRDNSEWAEARQVLDAGAALCVRAGLGTEPACLGIALDLGRIDFAERRVDAALARAEPLPAELATWPGTRDDLAGAYELLAGLRVLRNRADEAVALFRQALQLRRAQWGEGSVRVAQMQHRFGRTLIALRRLAQGEAELQAAWQTARAALGAEHVASARMELHLGRLQFFVGLDAQGLAHLRHAHDTLLAQAARLDPVELYEARAFWANALLLDGHLAEARTALDDAAARRVQLGPRAGADITLDVSQARWLSDTGRFADARAPLVRLRDAAIARHGADHPDVADRRLRLALAGLAGGDTASAEAELAAAMRTQDAGEAVFGSPKHRARIAQVLLWVEQGRHADAAALADALRRDAERTPRADQYREIRLQLQEAVARALAGAGRGDEAAPHFEQFIATLAATNPAHPWLAAMRGHYAASLLDRGQARAAREQVELAHAALAAQPLAGPQFHRPVRAAEVRLGAAEPDVRFRPANPSLSMNVP